MASTAQGVLAVSTHAPLRRGERHGTWCATTATPSFNPRPPPQRGATADEHLPGAGDEVSTHAPLRRGERRRYRPTARQSTMCFNPRPLRRGERHTPRWNSSWSSSFQPTPPSAEGSDLRFLPTLVPEVVSTHAPLRRGERRSPSLRPEYQTLFQPTPPSAEGSDRRAAVPPRSARVSTHAPLRRGERPSSPSRTRAWRCFNPRPPPQRGATVEGV